MPGTKIKSESNKKRHFINKYTPQNGLQAPSCNRSSFNATAIKINGYQQKHQG